MSPRVLGSPSLTARAGSGSCSSDLRAIMNYVRSRYVCMTQSLTLGDMFVDDWALFIIPDAHQPFQGYVL